MLRQCSECCHLRQLVRHHARPARRTETEVFVLVPRRIHHLDDTQVNERLGGHTKYAPARAQAGSNSGNRLQAWIGDKQPAKDAPCQKR